MTPAALAGGPTGTIHLTGVDTDVTLNNSATGDGAAYAKLIVDSGGAAGNDLVLNAITPEIDIAGPTAPATTTEALVISGEAMDIANLHTFNGSAATGDLTVVFNDHGTVAATGGAGDDRFVFTTPDGLSTFSGSTVDGGAGTNTLVIWADTGTILAATDGPNITNIATVVHNTEGAFGVLTADLTGLNPATIFDLNGTYDAAAVTVSNIANDQTVEFSGTSDVGVGGAFITLAAPTPLGLDAQINLQISDDAFLGQLIVAPGLASLNIHGLEGGGTIDDVGLVLDNINIDGDSFVSIGAFSSFGFLDPTRPTGGKIDAHTDTGGVEVFMVASPTATGLPAQTFIGGPGGGTVHLRGFGGTDVNFSIAGPDTIQF